MDNQQKSQTELIEDFLKSFSPITETINRLTDSIQNLAIYINDIQDQVWDLKERVLDIEENQKRNSVNNLMQNFTSNNIN